MTKITVFMACSQEAVLAFQENEDYLDLVDNDLLDLDYDYKFYEFDTQVEADAFMWGVSEANGWDNPRTEIIDTNDTTRN